MPQMSLRVQICPDVTERSDLLWCHCIIITRIHNLIVWLSVPSMIFLNLLWPYVIVQIVPCIFSFDIPCPSMVLYELPWVSMIFQECLDGALYYLTWYYMTFHAQSLICFCLHRSSHFLPKFGVLPNLLPSPQANLCHFNGFFFFFFFLHKKLSYSEWILAKYQTWHFY